KSPLKQTITIWDYFLSNCPVASLTSLLDNSIAFVIRITTCPKFFVNGFIHVNKLNIDVLLTEIFVLIALLLY
ncbi:MAG TPA: hypothetical protein VFY64_08485, partial [Nitrososphaeraceae archaeon]|nr:hypothetical protein [Nitrososphaeraceae archaeon]